MEQKDHLPKDRLKSAREAAGYATRQDAVSSIRGLNLNTLTSNENGNRAISRKMAQKYAEAFGVSAGWILYGDEEDATKPLEQNSPDDECDMQIPEYDVHVSAGGGALVDHETIRRTWSFSARYLSEFLGVSHSNLAIVEVRGDSMEPTLLSGDRVLINLEDRQISQSGIFALFDGGGTVVKRVEKRIGDDKNATLISDNPIHERYSVEMQQINVIGRVIWVARRL